MGKRSDFERIPRDLYATPAKAVLPLPKYLRRDGIRTFAELCAGNGDLIRHLEAHGLRCVHQSDITTGNNALDVKRYKGNPDVGITNPPFRHPEDPRRSTRLLRELIAHFLTLGKPFWLLLPHDFSTNQNAAPLMQYCSDIVVVGRVRWIEGTDNDGKDNSCWYRFDASFRGEIAFHNDRGEPVAVIWAATRRSRLETAS
ncbi:MULTISPECIES: hypothetical protein [Bradyrhizobium]|uniref:Uncharacterized protein n=1 Tax=Bradyrhizobium yuanmingense TaxID=108015 RepID=A0A1C3UD63_9BRAD|nr:MULTISPECIES: hypothetical protein [Bradyrhizobium]MCA1379838.1 hypothetical protein [Bradyrhizobium sp. BRP05]MCA1420148.1 hypothetical protein [Bradyrhizobium sp. BRP23]TWI20828.1 hypothetical protein IQ15_06170 [Bradyrhizobium yuanmingense]SCB13411.1 hypothetical protein GA0061099_1001975 [Bradyrhizobium yuanmingense]